MFYVALGYQFDPVFVHDHLDPLPRRQLQFVTHRLGYDDLVFGRDFDCIHNIPFNYRCGVCNTLALSIRRVKIETVPYGIERYTKETRRLWGVIDERLSTREWLAAEQYTIADIATFPWTARYEWQGIALDEFPNVKRWFETIYARPAVKQGMDTVYDNARS